MHFNLINHSFVLVFAISVLKTTPKNVDTDGTFLVRDQTGSDVDFALSFLHKSQSYHFFIKRDRDIFFCLEGGPVILGEFITFKF